MKSETSKWIFYNIVVCFAAINPLLWGFASYSCIIRYPKPSAFNGVLLNSLLFITEAIASDLIFFVVIRNAMDKLIHPTTFYACGFVILFPFIIYFLFKKLIERNKKTTFSF